MKQRLAKLVRSIATPWGLTALVAAGWLAAVVPELRAWPMAGPDMPLIIAALRSDHSLAAVWSWFTGPWVQGPTYYRPVISILHWADFLAWGSLGWGWRLTNALIIAATFPALTWLCAEGLQRPWAGPVAGLALTYSSPVSGMLLWPAWRTDAVCGIFLLLATGAALSWLREGRRGRLWLALAMLLLALMSKEVALIWPAFAAVTVLLYARDRRGLALLASAFALTGAFWVLRVHLLGHPLLGVPTLHVDYPPERQVWALLRTLLDPVYVDVKMRYPALLAQEHWILVPGLWRTLLEDAAFIGVNVMVGVASLRLLGLLWAWRAITYIPSLPFARIFDFYYYIPVLGTALLYGVGAVELVRRIAPHLRQWWTRHYRPDPAEDD